MANVNVCIIGGNLTDAPKIRAMQSGTLMAEFTLAVHRRINKDEEDVCFVQVTVWGKAADACQRYLGKGSNVLVRGFLKQSVWDDKDGHRRSALRLVSEEVQFLSAPRHGQGQQQQQQAQQQPQQQYQQQGYMQQGYGGGGYRQTQTQQQYRPVADEDLPGYAAPQPQADDMPF